MLRARGSRRIVGLLGVLSLPPLGACADWKVRAGSAAARVEEALSPAPPPPVPREVRDARFDLLVERYLDAIFRHDPPRATAAGVHDYDRVLGGYERERIAETVNALRHLRGDLAALDPQALSPDRRVDHGLLEHRVKADLLSLETIRPFERDPDHYTGIVSRGIWTLLAREFAPLADRVDALVARAEFVPAVFEAARANLRNPPRVWAEIAIEQARGALGYVESEIPRVLAREDLGRDRREAADRALALVRKSLEGYLGFLRDELLPRSRGDFALGAEAFARFLYYEDRIVLPPDRLLLVAEEELARLKDRFEETARRIDPNAPARELLARLAADHPAADAVLRTTDAGLEELRRFCVERAIVTFPIEERLVVQETPPFRRATTFASMDMPGPFEKVAREAIYAVTLPEPDASPERTEEQLGFLNRHALPVISIHEAYPGHFTQFLWVRQHPSRVRRFVGCSTNAEGWAHYAEEMMLEQGYGGGDAKLRLAQLRLALLRACRFVVAVRLHARGMTLPEAKRFFEENAYLEPANAEREARRGTGDPGFYAYTLGKLLILKLREDLRLARGEAFDLRAFHDAFLAAGYPPIPVVRALLLPGASGTDL